MRIASLWWILLAVGVVAGEDKIPIPSGFVQVGSVGRIHVFTPSKDTLNSKDRTAVFSAVEEMYRVYSTKYGLEHELMRVGVDGGIFKDMKRDVVGLYLFADQSSFDSWNGTNGVAGETQQLAHYVDVVRVSLNDGKLTAETRATLWHEFSRVFYMHYLWLGQPEWLDEGMGEFFAYSDQHGKGRGTERFTTMIKALEERRAAGKATPVRDLLLLHGDKFGRQQYDEAWILVHLLMTEAPNTLNALLSALVELEECAWDNLDGLVTDMHWCASELLARAFGSADKLQAAWDAHLDAIIADPSYSKHRRVDVSPLRWQRPFIIDARMGGGNQGLRRPIGTVRYVGPWPAATLRVLVAVGDGAGKWSPEYLLADWASHSPGDVIEFRELYMPDFKNARDARIIAECRIEGGGTYRARSVWTYR